MKPAVETTPLTLRHFCDDALLKIKKTMPDIRLRGLFDRRVGADITSKILELSRERIAGKMTQECFFAQLRKFLQKLATVKENFVVIYPGHSLYDDPRYIQTLQTFKENSQTLWSTQSGVHHGYKLNKEDKGHIQRFLEMRGSQSDLAFLEEYIQKTLPEYMNPPQESIVQTALAERQKIAELIEKKGPDAEKAGPDIPFRNEVVDILLGAWSKEAFSGSDEDKARDELYEFFSDFTIKDPLTVPVSEVMEKIFAPVLENKTETMKRMIVLEEIAMNSLLDLDRERLRQLKLEWETIMIKHKIPECQVPRIGILNCAILAKSDSLDAVRESMFVSHQISSTGALHQAIPD